MFVLKGGFEAPVDFYAFNVNALDVSRVLTNPKFINKSSSAG